jgi:DNA-binding MarR family transcriptional regulator
MELAPHIQLLTEFAAYQKTNPKASIADFCRFRLFDTIRPYDRKAVGGVLPPDSGALLMKLLHRMGKLIHLFSENAVLGTGLKSFEEFLILNAVFALKKPNKQEAIAANMMEYSTGINIIRRLIGRKFLADKPGQIDKRSRQLTITRTGEIILQNCYKQLAAVNELLLKKMDRENQNLAIFLIQDTEIYCSDLYAQQKEG